MIDAGQHAKGSTGWIRPGLAESIHQSLASSADTRQDLTFPCKFQRVAFRLPTAW